MNDNEVFVGKKPLVNYVMAVMTQIRQGKGTVWIRARGQSMVKAIDCAEVLKEKYPVDIEIGDIFTGTEEMNNEEGNIKVSIIEIEIWKR